MLRKIPCFLAALRQEILARMKGSGVVTLDKETLVRPVKPPVISPGFFKASESHDGRNCSGVPIFSAGCAASRKADQTAS